MAERKVRIGVIGVGGMGQGHCSYLENVAEAELTAVCDIEPSTAREIGAKHRVPYFLKHTDLLKSGLCDAVTIATPHPMHGPIAIDAMRAGFDVLCEKPLSEKVSMAEKVIATAKATGVKFAIMFQRRTEPSFIAAIAIAKSGKLGPIRRTCMIAPEYRSQAYYDSGGWRATWKGEGGGIMMNQAPHMTDLFLLLGGMPSQVYGRVETRLHNIEVEDLAEALLTYPDGGTGYYYTSTNESGPGEMIEIFGDAGKLVIRNRELKYYRYEPAHDEFTRTNTEMWGFPKVIEEPVEIIEKEAGHTVILRNFARHILYDEPLIAPGEDGLRSLELANAIWLSAHQGKPVSLPINRRAYDNLLAKKRRESTFVKVVHEQRVTDPAHVKK